MSVSDRAIRFAAIEARTEWEALKTEAASRVLDLGLDPEFMRQPELRCSWLADAMADVLHEETKIREELRLPGKVRRQIGGATA